MRTALYIYCLVGVLLLLVAAALTTVTAVKADMRLSEVKYAWDESKSLSAEAENAYSAMEAEQRANRALYTPEQAVQASYAVQAAQAAMLSARQDADVLQTKFVQLSTVRDRYYIALIPLVVFLLAHAFVAFMLFPKRPEIQPRWRQRR